jgi:uncharacterized protein (UPF0276 family)
MTVSFRQPVGTGPVPACAGIGLRSTHVHEILETRPALGWVEVHSENYFGRGIPRHYLERIRKDYPVSLHGVGLSVGSTDALSRDHLAALRELIADIDPLFVSEHLSWSSVGGRYLNDLLPLPCTEEALAHVIARVDEIQERLGRQMLIENISSYLQFAESAIPEWEFLAELATLSGCAVLLDVNNIFVSATNHGFDAHRYLQAIPVRAVREPPRGARGLAPVRGGRRALRCGAHADRVGQRPAPARRAAGRGASGTGDHGDPSCPRCVICR